MRCNAEVLGLYDHAGDANKLLYAPLTEALTFRESRRYTIEFDGDQEALEAFLKRVLADATSHELHVGDAPALDGFGFYLEYGMKPGALDLEKETILGYFRGLEAPGFTLKSLNIQRRIYIFGTAAAANVKELADRFAKDIVNTAIHRYSFSFQQAG